MQFNSIAVLRLSTCSLVVLGVRAGTKDTDCHDPDEADQSGKARPHNDLLWHCRASLQRGSVIGYMSIEQAVCLIGRYRASIAVNGFTREIDRARL